MPYHLVILVLNGLMAGHAGHNTAGARPLTISGDPEKEIILRQAAADLAQAKYASYPQYDVEDYSAWNMRYSTKLEGELDTLCLMSDGTYTCSIIQRVNRSARFR
jgi:hypothetical protein